LSKINWSDRKIDIIGDSGPFGQGKSHRRFSGKKTLVSNDFRRKMGEITRSFCG
jgi:hypothetical protein